MGKQQRPKWGDYQRYFTRNGYEIKGSGGDKIVIAPKVSDEKRTRNQVRIGHKCCGHSGDEVWDGYVKSIQRAFGLSPEEVLK